MSPPARTVSPLLTTMILGFFSSTRASVIHNLEVPSVVRNGTGPIDLSCSYEIRENENGLVIKWYHESDQIYQWIPPMPPQDVGIIRGIAEYPEEILKQPYSRSVIRLRVVTLEMAGEYACLISTFQEEAVERRRLVVYVPETNTSISASTLNETHASLSCSVYGARPRPSLRFYVEGIEIDGNYEEADGGSWGNFVKRRAVVKNSLEPMLVDCEISIPDTDYKRRERIVYYPTQSLLQRSNAVEKYRGVSLVGMVTVIVVLSTRLMRISEHVV